ncbi:MAG: hypothetical protein JWO10_1721 [Microbacteriaceae bacterium]|nr:hypothetical protein [Microbacteriaceae bacterium]
MTERRGAGTRPQRVAVIGAGVSGIAMGAKLVREGVTDFDIFEAAEGVGGTWWLNSYPGAAVDVFSTTYQYSFKNHPWKRTHGRRDELLEYLQSIAEEYGVLDHVRLSCPVSEIRWVEELQRYRLSTAHGDVEEYDVVVSAVGMLDRPNLPTWPGLDSFAGSKFHTAQWDHSVDLTGKRVGVVGVGSSSVQIVPTIQPIVESLHIFQREPGWVLPKAESDFTEAEVQKYSSLRRRKLKRWRDIIDAEWHLLTGPVHIAGNRANRRAEAGSRQFIDTVFADRPDLREAVTPGYVFSGKRRVLSSAYYPALLKDNVQLVPRAVERVTEHGVVDSDGKEYVLDVLVMATGFTAADYLSKLDVFGRDGQDLHEVWRDGAFALVGMTVPGFPNFYMMYGPNTNGSGTFSNMWNAEQEAKWVFSDLQRMKRRGFTTIEARPRVTERYNAWMQKRLERTAWARSNNYMKVNGRIVTQFHGTITLHWLLLRVMRRVGSIGARGVS